MLTGESCIKNIAVYSDDKKYRYILKKIWNEEMPKATFIGINPSDATELIMDKTVMNLTNYLINNNYGSVNIVNLFAYRDKVQKNLKLRSSEHEQENIEFIKEALNDSELTIIGWGRDAEKNNKYKDTIIEVKEVLSGHNVKCFKDKKGNINCHLSIGYSEAWELVEYQLL